MRDGAGAAAGAGAAVFVDRLALFHDAGDLHVEVAVDRQIEARGAGERAGRRLDVGCIVKSMPFAIGLRLSAPIAC